MTNIMYSIRAALADSLSIKEDSSVMVELFSRYITPQELLNISSEQLVSIKGITPRKAQQIAGTLKLARTINAPKVDGYKIGCPADAFQLVRHEVAHLDHERASILCLNTKNRVISNTCVGVGSLSAAVVHPRELFKKAILRSASSVIFYHNHPSGDPTPSQEDIALSRRLKECGELLGVELLDSLVIGANTYCSLKEQGMM
jgi:DNA repair protein radc